MTKGKLYEAVKELEEDHNYGFPELGEVLDEAKKEFQPWWILDEDGNDQIENGVASYEILDDIEKWFKKWFGDEP